VENIREHKGYSYSPHSGLDHSVAGSLVVVSADVATEVTGPALLETLYELGRLATLPVAPEELEQARQYLLGTLQLSISTLSGLAGLTVMYAGSGLRPDQLGRYVAQLSAATVDDIAEVAARYLAPARAVSVVLGDAGRVEPALAAITPVAREER
jgi:predicted Zn-dependent peptidase